MSTTTELLANTLLSPFQLTAGSQDFIMMLGLSALIILLMMKVYYLFFHTPIKGRGKKIF